MTSTTRTDAMGASLGEGTRRAVRRSLREADGPVSPVALAAAVAAAERGTTVEAAPQAAVRRCYLGLVHGLLPELAEAGEVDFDREANRVDLVGTGP